MSAATALTSAMAFAMPFGAERREAVALAVPGGGTLGATFHEPAAAPATKTSLLLLPGWSGPRTGPAELLVQLASRLAAGGHTVLRIDLHGRGDSSGAFEAGDLDRMIADASAGYDALRARAPGVPAAVGGICSGGNVALGLASLRPKDIPAAAAFSILPYQPARSKDFDRRRRWKNIKQYAGKVFRLETWKKLVRGEVNMDRVKKNLGTTEKKAAGERNPKDSARDIEKELLAWKGRALFVWGGGDEEAPPARAHFEKLHAAGCAAQVRFETIAGANHNFYNRGWREELARLTLSFLA
ncbi:MAG: alpha/beta fold hydrolase [Planctomycetota bacterium]|nr:alpha/beta fold hydrolase [Planctomycetota bacterium]